MKKRTKMTLMASSLPPQAVNIQPSITIDKQTTKISDLRIGETVSIIGYIRNSHIRNLKNNLSLLTVILSDDIKEIEIAYFLFTYFLRLVTVRPKFSTDKLYIDAFLSQTPLYKALGFVQTKDCYLDEKSGVVMMPMLFNISEIDNESSSL